MPERTDSVKPWRRRIEGFLLGRPRGAQLSSAIVVVATAFAFAVLSTEQFDLLPFAIDPSRRLGTRAISWILTLAVFYGVYLEERNRLSEVWKVSSVVPGLAQASARIDGSYGASLLCVGLLGEALVGLADLLRPDDLPLKSMPAAWSTPFLATAAYSILSISSLMAIAAVCVAHIRRHGRDGTAPSAAAPIRRRRNWRRRQSRRRRSE